MSVKKMSELKILLVEDAEDQQEIFTDSVEVFNKKIKVHARSFLRQQKISLKPRAKLMVHLMGQLSISSLVMTIMVGILLSSILVRHSHVCL